MKKIVLLLQVCMACKQLLINYTTVIIYLFFTMSREIKKKFIFL